MKLNCRELKTHFTAQLDKHKALPTRVHILFDDLNPFLSQHKKVDVFDLLVELILYADNDPALYLSTLLAALDDEALIELDRNAVSNAGAFIRDTMKQDWTRIQLQAYRQIRKGKKKQRKND